MKYIITESRLENVIFKYLDRKLDGIKLKKGKYVDSVLAFTGQKYGLIGYLNFSGQSGDLYIFVDLRNNIMSMFSMEKDDAIEVIKNYVENRYNFNVNYTHVAHYIPWAELQVMKP
jgi:hypothetical protein